MVFRSPLPPVIVPETTITGFVLAAVAAHPDKPALVDGPTGRTLTYAELDRAIRSLAGGLVARGFQRGQVVALMAPNCPEFAVALHGVALAGGVVTTINPTYTVHEVQRQLADSGATAVITVGALLGTVAQAAEAPSVPSAWTKRVLFVHWIANSVAAGLPFSLIAMSSDDAVGLSTVGASGTLASVVKFSSLAASVEPAVFSA